MAYLEAKLERIEGSSAVLLTDQDLEIRWPKSLLPSWTKIGQRVCFRLLDEKHASAEKKELAYYLLGELLNGGKRST